MPEITKSGAKLHLFIVTHKYTDLYFIFSFNNQPQVGKPTWGYDYTTVLRRLPSPTAQCEKNRHHHRIAPTARYTAIGEKTAEERFNMLARGWLAYPVTPTHAHLPPKSGCINVIPACARGALLLVTPSARRDSGGRMGHRRDTISMRFGDALLPPLGAAHPHRKNRHPSARYTAIGEKPPKSGLIC